MEDAAHDAALREAFDFAVARAVTQLPALSEYLLPFVKISGKMIAQKSAGCDHEIAAADTAIKTLGGRFEAKIPVHLPIEPEGNAGKRALVVVRKIAPTPNRYPRQAGTPTRDPIS